MNEEDFTAPVPEGTVAVEDRPAEVVGSGTPGDPFREQTVEAPAEGGDTADKPAEAKPAEVAKPAGPTEEEINAALAAFTAVLDEVSTGDVKGEREATTGAISDDLKAKVQTAFAALPRGNTKTSARPRAKDLVDVRLQAAMEAMDMPLARTLFTIVQECLTVRGAGGESTGIVRTPVDPTDAFVEQVTALSLAPYALVPSEEVKADWPARVEALVNELVSQVGTYAAWVSAEGETDDEGKESRGDEPEVHALVKQAVGIAAGKRAVKRTRKAAGEGGTSTPRAPYTGTRRSVGKHIEQVFADVPDGEWLSISQIANAKSDEYGDERVSQGAVSARLYASGGCTVRGVKPQENADGKKGAVKVPVGMTTAAAVASASAA